MHKKFEINRTKIKGSCQSGRKMVTHNSKSDLPLAELVLEPTQVLAGLFRFKSNELVFCAQNAIGQFPALFIFYLGPLAIDTLDITVFFVLCY